MVAAILTDYEGRELVKFARQTVESYVSNKELGHGGNRIQIKAGAFVSLFRYNDLGHLELRGCIGYPYADNDLNYTIKQASIAAATRDPRFKSITSSELSGIIFEVSVLTSPSRITINNPDDYLGNIRIGIDGLILYWEYGSGLFLPQVPVEYNWSVKEYLANLCNKAGAPSNIWQLSTTKVYKFQAVVFREIKPNGDVIKVSLDV